MTNTLKTFYLSVTITLSSLMTNPPPGIVYLVYHNIDSTPPKTIWYAKGTNPPVFASTGWNFTTNWTLYRIETNGLLRYPITRTNELFAVRSSNEIVHLVGAWGIVTNR